MKKIISLMIVVFLVLVPVSAFADTSLNVSAKPTDSSIEKGSNIVGQFGNNLTDSYSKTSNSRPQMRIAGPSYWGTMTIKQLAQHILRQTGNLAVMIVFIKQI
ncbi:hypothetical protein QS257_02355 [Terrilactibacillus sp. S3-3]|nr:hypothetical protein QS257_02355 [Terrilactibacillus sp. S3-3]